MKRIHVTSTPQRKQTGLDDGPPLPSRAALDRAERKILEAQPFTDAERMNWIEKQKYIQTGIGWSGSKFEFEIRIHDKGLQRFFGRTAREALDRAIKGTT